MKTLSILLLVSSIFLFSIRPLNVGSDDVPETPEPSSQEVHCLAEAIYHESRGEPISGRIAVAHVIMNRVSSKRFPDSTCKVVHQKISGVCQFYFSCVRMKYVKRQEDFEVAMRVLSGEYIDPTKGALFFHANHISHIKHRWSMIIGNQTFYK